jgi:putative methionine-R-sulfoxide reductase with GAF domain
MRATRYDLVILDIQLSGDGTIGQIRAEILRLFPDLHYDEKEGRQLQGYFFTGEFVRDETMVSGAYLVPPIRAIDREIKTIILTDCPIDETVAAALREVDDKIDKMLVVDSPRARQELATELLVSIAKIFPPPSPVIPPEGPRPALPRFKGIEDFIDDPSRSLAEVIKSHLEKWEGYEVRAEVLYLNQSQRLLERIIDVGFVGGAPSVFLRHVENGARNGKGLCSYAAAHNESVLVPNVKFDNRYLELHAATQSELVVPLKIKDEVVGVLNLEADEVGAFDNHHLEYFQRMSPILALLVENETFKREERILTESIKAMLSGPDDGAGLLRILDGAIELLGYDARGCILVESESATGEPLLMVVANRGLDRIQVGQSLRLDDLGVIKKALRENRDQYWTYLDSDTQHSPLTTAKIRSEYVKLLKVRGKLTAVLNIESELIAISERHRRAIDRLITYAAAFQSGVQESRESELHFARTLLRSTFHTLSKRLETLLVNLGDSKVDPKFLGRLRLICEQTRQFEKYSQAYAADKRLLLLSTMLRDAKEFASGLDLHLRVDRYSETLGVYASEIGVSFIMQNLLLNTHGHALGPSRIAHVELSQPSLDERCTLSYWDHGPAPDNAVEIFEVNASGNGIKIIKEMCQLMDWTYSSSRHPDGGLLVKFGFWPVVGDSLE